MKHLESTSESLQRDADCGSGTSDPSAAAAETRLCSEFCSAHSAH